jgi:hypothetical protein
MAAVSALKVTRRDIAVVLVTALVCFVVVIPLTSASTGKSQAKITIWPSAWPSGRVRFAYVDWACSYYHGSQKPLVAPQVECGRASTMGGVRTTVNGNYVTMWKCPSKGYDCKVLLRTARTP